MEVRDAVEADAEALAALTDVPPEVLRNVVHDRTVRVLVAEDDPDPDDDTPVGFVSFDVRDDAVHLTQFGGDREACERLLAEPVGFAENEGLAVEVLVEVDSADPARQNGDSVDDGVGDGDGGDEADGNAAMRAALEAAGFELAGRGPAFGGTDTYRYRLEPEPPHRDTH